MTRPGSWRVLSLEELAGVLADRAGRGPHPVALIAVDGHSASGKTTLARRLAAVLPRSALLHSDDIAWHHSLFDWRELLVDGVLRPLWAGRAVDYGRHPGLREAGPAPSSSRPTRRR